MRHRRSLVLASILLAVGPVAPLHAQRTFPGAEWPTATPASLGLNAAVLDSIDREIAAGTYGNVDRFLVIRHGQVAVDRRYARDYDRIYGDSARVPNALNAHHLTSPYNYFNPWWHPTYRRGTLHTLQSVTKTVTSVVIGTALARGEFPSIDTPILAFFDTTRVQHLDDRKRRVTIRHLLTMSGGFDWNENLPYIDPKNTGAAMEASHDWVQYMIDRPMAREPGASFNYSSGETELLAWIFHRATGEDIESYAARHLFAPLGIRDWHWKRTPNGLIDTEGGLYLDGGDLARIWWLFLAGGTWNGTTVVTRDWVRQSTARQIVAGNRAGAPGYGFKWWLYPLPSDPTRDVWGGSGFGGQQPLAFPDKDMVVVFNAWNILPGMPGVPLRAMLKRLEASAR